jgi:hypothetical protein
MIWADRPLLSKPRVVARSIATKQPCPMLALAAR